MLATAAVGALRTKHAVSDGLVIATSVVLIAWAFPLVRAAYDTIRFRGLALQALDPVSDIVRWTYGCALAAVPLIALGWLLRPTHVVVLGVLLRFVAIAAVAGLALHVAMSAGMDARRIALCIAPSQRRRDAAYSHGGTPGWGLVFAALASIRLDCCSGMEERAKTGPLRATYRSSDRSKAKEIRSSRT
jgi:hypothetical protein